MVKRTFRFLPAIIGCIAVVIAVKPLLVAGITSGHDVGSHLVRVQRFYEALRQGQFPVRWIEGVLPAMGHPHFEFYPPFFYYLTSLVQLLGLDFVSATKAVIIASAAIGFGAMYLLAQTYFASAAGIAAAVLFTFSPYRLSQLYVRAAYGEYLATALAPLAFVWINRPIPLALALTAIALTHQPAFLILVPALASWMAITWIKSRDTKGFLKSLTGLGLFLGLIAFFILPAMAERKFIHWTNLTRDYYNFRQHFAGAIQLVYSKWDYGISVAGRADTMSFQLGVVNWLMVMAALVLLYLKRIPKLFALYSLLFTLLGLFMATPLSTPAWERFSILAFIQYPWRFLLLSTFTTSLLAGIVASSLLKKFQKSTQMVIIVLFSIITMITNLNYIKPSTYLPKTIFDLNSPQRAQPKDPMSGLEPGYLPVFVREISPDRPQGAAGLVSGDAAIRTTVDNIIEKRVSIEAKTDIVMRFFVHYFPGWQAKLGDTSPRLLAINPDNPEGFIDITVPKGSHTVNLRFTRTPARDLGDFISLVTLVILLVLLIKPKVSKPKLSQ